MNAQFLRSLDAVARHGSLSAAAQSLGISQPAVTQHIKALERDSGRPLLLRQASGAVLTAEGEALLPRVRQALLVLDDLEMRLFGRASPEGGCLSIGQCAPHLVMPVLGRFMAACPTVRLEVLFDNSARLLEMVEQSRIDIAMLTLTEPLPHLACTRLVALRLMFVLPAGHPWSNRAEIDLSEATDETIIMREVGSSTRQLFEGTAQRLGVVFPQQFVMGSREAMKEAVAAGLGIGVVFDAELGADERLVGVPIRDSSPASEYLVCRQEVSELGVVAAFIAAARAQYESA
ncbi:LysR substrate-binding domain-containing protein [Paracoccus suum]|nr:LysR substrate-binding domain-containing protein [Paracoccus suum]